VDIVSALREAGRGLDDDELAEALGVDRREVLRQCRRLAFQGLIIREATRDGRLMNKLDGGNTPDGRLYFEDHISINR
jgi:transcription initiation factor IIE alpha subunit